jgi:hypothetical protein
MPGLLDFFTSTDPAQQQGLLAAAAQILQASGPSLRPTSFGQIIGQGMGAYQQGMNAAQDRGLQLEQARQLAQLRDFAIKDKKSDLETQEAQRQRAKSLLSLTSDYWKGGQGQGQGQAPAFPGGQSADSLMRGMASFGAAAPAAQLGGEVFYKAASDAGLPTDNATLNQIVVLTNHGMQPDVAARSLTAGQPQRGSAQQPSGGGLDRGAMTNQRLAYAQFLRQNGFGQEAQAEEDSALKLQPKVKGWEKVQVGGKVLFAPFFEDGSSGQPVPLEVAEKLDTVNRGGSTDMVNPFTGATVRSMTNSASPDAQLGAGTAARRLAFDQQQAGKPIFNAEAGGFVLPPSTANPGGKLLPVAGVGGKAPTEFQGKSAAFGLRATEADKILRELDGQYSRRASTQERTRRRLGHRRRAGRWGKLVPERQQPAGRPGAARLHQCDPAPGIGRGHRRAGVRQRGEAVLPAARRQRSRQDAEGTYSPAGDPRPTGERRQGCAHGAGGRPAAGQSQRWNDAQIPHHRPGRANYDVNAPDGASEQDVLAYAQRSFKMAAAPKPEAQAKPFGQQLNDAIRSARVSSG